MQPVLLFLLLLCAQPFVSVRINAGEAWSKIEKSGVLRWGGDLSGGAPYVFPDPGNPKNYIGFEVEIMEAIARQLNVKPVLVDVPWDQLVPALLRGDFEVVFNGLEITQGRKETIDFTTPYYFFSEQITTRLGEERFHSLQDLHGFSVGTLSASLAQNILEKEGHIRVVPYGSPVEAYRDLEIGRIEAALFDVPIAAWYAGVNPKLQNLQNLVGEGIYAGGVRKDSPILREKLNTALKNLIQNGELESIYRKWHMWTPAQKKLQNLANESQENGGREKIPLKRFAGVIAQGAAMTLLLAFLSMGLAVMVGMSLCLGKLYAPKPIKYFCTCYIEIVRGTPLLIQLYLLYYGLPNIGIELDAFLAAILGLGLNYGAYEAEIYRAGILSIPRGQHEAALSIGMTGTQTLRYVIIPQSIAVILPPSTNDFIALFKDTSLVSIITVMELTRAYSQAANTTYRFLELGLCTALLYFLMSFPLSLWARKVESKQQRA